MSRDPCCMLNLWAWLRFCCRPLDPTSTDRCNIPTSAASVYVCGGLCAVAWHLRYRRSSYNDACATTMVVQKLGNKICSKSLRALPLAPGGVRLVGRQMLISIIRNAKRCPRQL
eukprot:365479-Chlamydomonas_euryale.AAC.3